MSLYTVVSPKREGFRGWYAKVSVATLVYFVGVERGNKVRIPFKPRGPKGWGFEYWGLVRDEGGKTLFYDRVPGSLGIRGLLLRAFPGLRGNDKERG